jgi:nicotinamide-nucleotide amidase
MFAEIITIGDELLIGQVIDTNSAWIGEKLNLSGIEVLRKTSISDKSEEIKNALREALNRSSIVIITGGLGPTKDDLTKAALCSFFNVSLVFQEELFQDVKSIFRYRGLEISPLNRKQAEVPENCIYIRNKNGTAPGMWFETDGKIIVSMPGVPYEMKAMMEGDVLPRLKQQFNLPAIFHKTILTQGIGESFLSELVSDWEDALTKKNIKLAYLPAAGKVRLRLSAYGDDKNELMKLVENEIEKVKPLINEYIYGFENFGESEPAIAEIAGERLKKNKSTVATAESCTGGYIAHLITCVPGSSAYYLGSIISYSNEIKIRELAVKPEDIEKNGVVSQQVVEQMAAGAKIKLNADYVIAASGIAGPDGGTPEKPVGTVWIAIATPGGMISKKFLFGNNRGRNIERTALSALKMLTDCL